MEVFLYNSTVCRLCGEENDRGSLLYSNDENNQNLSQIVNLYLPIKVSDDGELPRTICPGCTIQLEATVEFLNLIINGQKIIRDLHQREKEYKKNILENTTNSCELVTKNIIYEINTSNGVYQVEHPIALQVSSQQKPKRRRGRPSKKPKSPEELAKEAEEIQIETIAKPNVREDEIPGKRRRKTPTRFKEAVQGKELERIFKEEGVTDGEDSDKEVKNNADIDVKKKETKPKEPEIIGHLETSGELVVVVRGKGRGRPKGTGRSRPTREECAICGMQFSCIGRYMSHVAQHGPVLYQCGACAASFATRLDFTQHQRSTGHVGQNVIPSSAGEQLIRNAKTKVEVTTESPKDPQVKVESSPPPEVTNKTEDDPTNELMEKLVSEETVAIPMETTSHGDEKQSEDKSQLDKSGEIVEMGPRGKVKLKCNQCDKTFNSKQSKSLHIKAVHQGERAYRCLECGLAFAYPRSLALHCVAHRRQRPGARRYACDLCGKVLNHPSSVVYHKEAEHAGQRYVCNKCGKSFKHKQLLQRHQLVHSQLRPYNCKTCNASFKTKANLINHQLLHSGVKKFSCELCKHKFAHKTSLTLHMRWHTGTKPFACKVCGKSFSQKGNLSEHARIHTGEKPYACALCSRRFTTSSQARLHARRHQPERPYACTRCPKRFVSRGSWALHQRREAASGGATGPTTSITPACADRWALKAARRPASAAPRPYRCALCPRAFAHAANLHRHRQQVHKQVSLLMPDKIQPPDEIHEPEGSPAGQTDLEERVIYVTYDVDVNEPAYHILDPEQTDNLEESKVLNTCELYSGPSLLVSRPPMLELQPELAAEDSSPDDEELAETVVEVDDSDHIAVTDEEGNPLHFTMQDGTRLAITSTDGKSLQVITHDGQTIPVEINGYNEDNETEEEIPETVDLEKDDNNSASPVAHFYTIV